MTISQLHPRWVRHVSLACVLALSACGGGGGGSSNNASNAANAQIAAQVADIAPNNDTDTTSVFVKLGNSSAAASGAAVAYSDASRTQLQTQFLEDLKTAVGPKVLLGVSTSPACDTTGFAQQLQNAHQYAADAVVRLDLTACQLNLLPTLPNVQGVYPDITLDHQSFAASNVTSLNNAIDFSFNATPSRQINGKSADGTSVVIAVMDTGVEERHPALGSAKVLPGACFSTASNGGSSFCAGSGNQFIETIEDPNIPGHTRAARSCADASAWSDRQTAISAGCIHGTAMASAAAMGVMASSSNTQGVIAKGGIAPQASILPIQVFSKSGNSISASSGDLLAALEWLVKEAQRRKDNNLPPLVAVNMSLGGGSYTQSCDSDYRGGLFNNVFAKLRTLGVLPVVAAGNSGTQSAIAFPACVSNTLSVAATQLNGQTIASYSNFSNQVKLFSIGGDRNGEYTLPTLCVSTATFDCWDTMAGTSPATALVSGGVAALASLKPTASLGEIESALTTSTGGSAKTITLNGVTKPALRLTASGYKLVGTTEPNSGGVPPTLPGDGNQTTSPQARICLYSGTNYLGNASCAVITLGSAEKWYKLGSKVGSVKIEAMPTTSQLPANAVQVTLFHYAVEFKTHTLGASFTSNVPDTKSLNFLTSGIPNIYGLRIQSTATP